MAAYTVAFLADGTLQKVEVDEIKPAKGYIRCQKRIENDDELAGVFPFESIEYIVHNKLEVTDVESSDESETT